MYLLIHCPSQFFSRVEDDPVIHGTLNFELFIDHFLTTEPPPSLQPGVEVTPVCYYSNCPARWVNSLSSSKTVTLQQLQTRNKKVSLPCYLLGYGGSASLLTDMGRATSPKADPLLFPPLWSNGIIICVMATNLKQARLVLSM